MTVKINRLTYPNVEALRMTLTDEEQAGTVTVTATTATFHMGPTEAVRLVQELQQRAAQHGRRQHPYTALHAVLRKVQAAQ